MSSLFEKVKAMVSASLRGPQRRESVPDSAAETAQRPALVPEITEASGQQHQVPEVTDAPQTAKTLAFTEVPESRPVSRIEAPGEEAAQARKLEEERVVDLLKDSKS